MYKKLIPILLLAFFFGINCRAQKNPDSVRHFNNAVYLELGGPTLAYSFGYERTWFHNNRIAAISSAGFSYIPNGVTMGYIEPGILLRNKNLALELGVALMSYTERPSNGAQFATSDGSGSAKMLNLNPRVGVRFFTKNQRFHFRTSITPFVEIWNNDPKGWPQDRRLFLWFNVFTVGYRF